MSQPPPLTKPLLTVQDIEEYPIYGNAFHDSCLFAALDEIIQDLTQPHEMRVAAYIKLGDIVGEETDMNGIDEQIQSYIDGI
jgi:hypothetical protein